jgi:hypothetical protein
MILYLGVVALIATLAVAGRVAANAIEEEYLLVLRWKEHGLWIFERDEDGRYARIPLPAVPAALVRYARRGAHPRPLPVRLPRRTAAADAA